MLFFPKKQSQIIDKNGIPIKGSQKTIFSWERENVELKNNESINIQDINYLSEIAFEDDKTRTKILKKCIYFLRKGLIDTHRLWLGSYYSNEVDNRKSPFKLVVKKVNDVIGFGVFANEDIPPFKFIGEYSGVVRKRKKRILKNNDYCLRYSIEDFSEKKYIIDAMEYGNYTRFINHSYNSNTEFKAAFVNNIIHMLVLSTKPIFKNQQLTLDYGTLFWNDSKMIPNLL
jgi:uncharacterized protein